jgi:hypothetical protein
MLIHFDGVTHFSAYVIKKAASELTGRLEFGNWGLLLRRQPCPRKCRSALCNSRANVRDITLIFIYLHEIVNLFRPSCKQSIKSCLESITLRMKTTGLHLKT